MTDSELGAKVIEAVLMLDMAMHGPSQGAREHGREQLGKAVRELLSADRVQVSGSSEALAFRLDIPNGVNAR
jgi:hypothetical protein